MPLALQGVDWAEAQSLYFAGFEPKQIAAKLNVSPATVRQRVTRGQWSQLRDKAKVATPNGQEGRSGQGESALDSHSNRSRQALAAVLTRSAEQVGQMPVTSAKHALKVNRELEPLVRNAKAVFGWNDTTTQPLVRIAILAQASIAPAVPQAPTGYVPDGASTLPVIDTETLPPPSPEALKD